ncbi:hypothetical protein [Nocardia sp. NPDC020380]|uniref:hypothetical protein n=1 Tax=Nocardia sp. NPDC020380 TaxID=3364309 RepID=UPI00378F17F4
MHSRIPTMLAVSAGAAAVSLGAAGIAAAHDVAPGITCHALTCTNDNDDPYTISGVAYCQGSHEVIPPFPDMPPGAPQTYDYPFSGVVAPHSTQDLAPLCRGSDIVIGGTITSATPDSGD